MLTGRANDQYSLVVLRLVWNFGFRDFSTLEMDSPSAGLLLEDLPALDSQETQHWYTEQQYLFRVAARGFDCLPYMCVHTCVIFRPVLGGLPIF